MSDNDFRKAVLGVLLQFGVTAAGCLAALFLWRNVLGNALLIN
jgi:hypothetical protein